MLRKSLLAIFTFTPIFVYAEAYSFKSYDDKKSTPVLRRVVEYSPRFYVEAFGSVLPDHLLWDLSSLTDEEESKGINTTAAESKEDYEQRISEADTGRRSRRGTISGGEPSRRSSSLYPKGTSDQAKKTSTRSSGRTRKSQDESGISTKLSKMWDSWTKRKSTSSTKKTTQNDGASTHTRRRGRPTTRAPATDANIQQSSTRTKSAGTTRGKSKKRKARGASEAASDRRASIAPSDYNGDIDDSDNEDEITYEEHSVEPISSLNELMHKHAWLAGLTGGYRWDRDKSIEVTVPVGAFSPFYMLPSIGGKYTFPKHLGKCRFYGKIGVGIPFARLKLSEAARLRKESINKFYKESGKPVQDENLTAKWQYDIMPMCSLGFLFPVYPNLAFEGSFNVMRPFTVEEVEAGILPNPWIGSIQLGFRWRLG